MKTKKNKLIMQSLIGLIIAISFFIANPANAQLGPQASAATEIDCIFPKISSYFIGFDFTGYTFPLDSSGKKYNKKTITEKLLYPGSAIAFEVPAGSSTATFINSSSPITDADIDIGLIDANGNEFTVNATAIINTNSTNSIVIKSEAFPTGITQGLGTLVTVDGGSATVIEKTPIFVTQSLADRDGISNTFMPVYNRAISAIKNAAKGLGLIYFTGTQLPGSTLQNGSTILAKKKSGLTRVYYAPSGIRGRISKAYGLEEVIRQKIKITDKALTGTGIAIAVSLWGIELIDINIPACTKSCGFEVENP